MNWIKNVNAALSYIEQHLDKPIIMDEVAKRAHFSGFHFQRMFYIITSMTLGEYIRKRRLTLAVHDLVNQNQRVIDVALKYQYESPEAFSKAFKKFHGILPSKAKTTPHSFCAILPITIEVTMKGAEIMEYRIESKQAMTFRGVTKSFTSENDQNLKELPKFWEEIWETQEGKILVDNESDLGVVGICYGANDQSMRFNYMIGIENCESAKKLPNDLTVEATDWAIFPSRGPLPGAIQAVWKRIYSEFFPGTNYKHTGGPELEVYSEGDTTSADYYCEVWIPVVKI